MTRKMHRLGSPRGWSWQHPKTRSRPCWFPTLGTVAINPSWLSLPPLAKVKAARVSIFNNEKNVSSADGFLLLLFLRVHTSNSVFFSTNYMNYLLFSRLGAIYVLIFCLYSSKCRPVGTPEGARRLAISIGGRPLVNSPFLVQVLRSGPPPVRVRAEKKNTQFSFVFL